MPSLLDNLYLPVFLKTLLVDTVRTFDIYIRLGGEKMVLYHRGGELFSSTVRSKLLDNRVRYVYIKNQDKDLYKMYLEENLMGLLRDPDITVEQRSEIAHISVLNTAKSLFEEPSIEAVVRYKNSISILMKFIFREPEGLTNLIRLTSYDFTLYTHSVNVGIFAIGLAKALFINNKTHNMSELAAGFFLHDIGKCTIPQEILRKHGQLTKDEWTVIHTHPAAGQILLEKYEALTKESNVIVMQHHERNDGSGYPKGLNGADIHIYSKICAIADVFEALTAIRPYKKSHSAFSALTIMKNEMHNGFDPQFFHQFIVMFSDKRLTEAREHIISTFDE